jgi:hypothetical protein
MHLFSINYRLHRQFSEIVCESTESAKMLNYRCINYGRAGGTDNLLGNKVATCSHPTPKTGRNSRALLYMLIKIKILRQEINLNRDYSHSATSSIECAKERKKRWETYYHVIWIKVTRSGQKNRSVNAREQKNVSHSIVQRVWVARNDKKWILTILLFN